MLHPQDKVNRAQSLELQELEHKLVLDTESYLDERARGLVPSSHLSEAWEQFFVVGTSVIQWILQARGLSGADRDDCEQEFWAAVIAQLGRFRYEPTRAGVRTWLTALARTKAADMNRRRVRCRPRRQDEVVLAALPSRDVDAASVLEHKQDQAFMQAALAELSQVVSDCSFRVLILRSIEELDVSEVAASVGLTPDQVRHRHCRVKQELRRLVEQMAHPRSSSPNGR